MPLRHRHRRSACGIVPPQSFGEGGDPCPQPGVFAYLGRETVFVLDKTGTVTEGHFVLCKGLEVLSFDDQRALKGLVAQSLHPIAAAIHHNLFCPPAPFEQVEEILGKGIKGIWQGRSYCIGSAPFLIQQGIAVPEISNRTGPDCFDDRLFCKRRMLFDTADPWR